MTEKSVLTGLDVLAREDFDRLRGRRLGVLTNPSAVDADYRHLLDLLAAARIDVRVVFGPEHGLDAATPYLRAIADDRTGPVKRVSLYGDSFESLRPKPQDLVGLDAVLFDMQDVGSRYYTFQWTMAMMIEATAAAGVAMLVLDRPNPLGCAEVEGGGLPKPLRSFVGYREVPNRHGMTVGEVARMVAAQAGFEHLEVVAMPGYRRTMWLDDTGAPWVIPSPSMPRTSTALVYPGQCLIEGTNLSEGRGTGLPFELCGAPFVDGRRLADALGEHGLPGVRFRPAAFCPTDDKWRGALCQGVQFHLVDRVAYRPYRTTLALLRECWRLWPDAMAWRTEEYEFRADVPAFDLLTGDPTLRGMLENGEKLESMMARVEATGAQARKNREIGLLYQ